MQEITTFENITTENVGLNDDPQKYLQHRDSDSLVGEDIIGQIQVFQIQTATTT